MECKGVTSCWFREIRLLSTYRPVPMGFQLKTVTRWQSVHQNLNGILAKVTNTLDETNGWETTT